MPIYNKMNTYIIEYLLKENLFSNESEYNNVNEPHNGNREQKQKTQKKKTQGKYSQGLND